MYDNEMKYTLNYKQPEQALYQLYFLKKLNYCEHGLFNLHFVTNNNQMETMYYQATTRCYECYELALMQNNGLQSSLIGSNEMVHKQHIMCQKCGTIQTINQNQCQNCMCKFIEYFCKECKLGIDISQQMYPIKHCQLCNKCHFVDNNKIFCNLCKTCHKQSETCSDKCVFCAFCGDQMNYDLQQLIHLSCGHIYHSYCFYAFNCKCCFCVQSTRLNENIQQK